MEVIEADFCYCPECGSLVMHQKMDCKQGACYECGKIVDLNRRGWFVADDVEDQEPFGPYKTHDEAEEDFA